MTVVAVCTVIQASFYAVGLAWNAKRRPRSPIGERGRYGVWGQV
jgi:hypothetical protein